MFYVPPAMNETTGFLGRSNLLTDYLNVMAGARPKGYDSREAYEGAVALKLREPADLALFQADLKERTDRRNERLFGALPRSFRGRLKREKTCYLGYAWLLVHSVSQRNPVMTAPAMSDAVTSAA